MDQTLQGTHAIVIGASMAGLISARVLADHFDSVTVCERDRPGTLSDARKGTPQGRHVHALLNAGERVISSLFPEVTRTLVEGGASRLDFGRDVRWQLNGAWLPRFESGMTTFFMTRPFLEWHVRQAVEAVRNVAIRDETAVTGYLFSPDGSTVRGIRVDGRGSADGEIEADLVVDAAGRGSSVLRWLREAGFAPPPESNVGVDLGYASCLFRRPAPYPHDWKCLLIYPDAPRDKRGGTLVSVEKGLWQLTVAGYHGDHPTADGDEFMSFARGLPSDEIFEAVKSAEPVTQIALHRFPGGRRRHFDRAERLPERLVLTGDVVCSLNPFFGQGMSTAALQAEALGQELDIRRRTGDGLDGLSAAYFKRISRLIDVPWEMATGQDFKYPETTGRRPASFPVTRWYKDRLVASHDQAVIGQFFRVLHLVASPSSLMTPSMFMRALVA